MVMGFIANIFRLISCLSSISRHGYQLQHIAYIIQRASAQAVKQNDENNMHLNADKRKDMKISFGKKPPTFEPVRVNGSKSKHVEHFKWFGVVINNKWKWYEHIEYIRGKLHMLRLC